MRPPKRHDLEHDFWHEGEHQKTRFLARRRAPKNTILSTDFGTRKSTKKQDSWHDGEHQKASGFFARRRAPKSMIESTVFGTNETTKKARSTILGTKENTKKHIFLARRRAPILSTDFGTRESTKKEDSWHEGEHQKVSGYCCRSSQAHSQ